MAKEAQHPARFLSPSKVPIGRFEVSMNLIDSPKPYTSLKIRFESSTVALTKLLLYWRLKLKLKIDADYINICIEL